jgi:polysaccharide pyruvyl transferase CsaB
VRVTVAAWIGSANAGDALIFTALRRKLLARGTRVTAISTRAVTDAISAGAEAPAEAPAETADADHTDTEADHTDAETDHAEVEQVDHRALWSIALTIRGSDALIFGGGGLLQDQTSSFNLPYHLSRIAMARAFGTPFAAVGVGAGPLRTAAGRWQVRRALRGAVAISARDEGSVELLRTLGVPGVELSADLAVSLPEPDVAPADVICACLRPWRAARGRLPVATRTRSDITPTSMVARLAVGLDDASTRMGLPVRLVALQRGWDDLLHQRVAERMTRTVVLVTPPAHAVLDVIAASRVVVAMRYHAGIGALLAGRPAVLIGYDPKLDGLAGALGPAGALLPWAPDALAGLGPAVAAVAPHAARVPAALAGLRTREAVNDRIIDDLLARAEPRT